MRDDDRERRQAQRDLDRLGGEGGLFGGPMLRSKVNSVRDHFSAGDADQNDPIEVSATRTGRLLALVAFVVLAFWLASMLNLI